MQKHEVVERVAAEVKWWVFERRKKLEALSHDSMAVNPFMAPLVFGLNGFSSFTELADFLLGAHFSIGHSTGFGKLIDEKILPRVFGTTKLDAQFRRVTPFDSSMFDEIDHLVKRPSGHPDLLSLKASKWTIQLTMAVQLNHAFKEIVDLRSAGKMDFNKIVVGIFYGKNAKLTDKYDICRGINRGKKHSVYDLTSEVDVLAGREFWSWLNEGIPETQEWIMEGILLGYSQAEQDAKKLGLPTYKNLSQSYQESFLREYSEFISTTNNIDWYRILRKING